MGTGAGPERSLEGPVQDLERKYYRQGLGRLSALPVSLMPLMKCGNCPWLGLSVLSSHSPRPVPASRDTCPSFVSKYVGCPSKEASQFGVAEKKK